MGDSLSHLDDLLRYLNLLVSSNEMISTFHSELLGKTFYMNNSIFMITVLQVKYNLN